MFNVDDKVQKVWLKGPRAPIGKVIEISARAGHNLYHCQFPSCHGWFTDAELVPAPVDNQEVKQA